MSSWSNQINMMIMETEHLQSMDKEEAREAKANSNTTTNNKKKKLMKYLPRALTFQNPRFSPAREFKLQPPRLSDAYKSRAANVFSGPLTALVPIEARGHGNNKKEKEGTKRDARGGFDSDVEEPKSPKVSCIGQIKQKKKLHKLKREKSIKLQKLETNPRVVVVDKVAKKNPNAGFGNIFRRKSKSFAAEKTVEAAADPPPGLSQMKRFSSGRDALANFDWTKQQVAPVDRECYSDDDEQRRDYWDDDEEEEEEFGDGRNDVMIPFSAPMTIGGGEIQLEPRKEICLWKKRNMPPPKPLQLNNFR